jgi:hypothetical protein
LQLEDTRGGGQGGVRTGGPRACSYGEACSGCYCTLGAFNIENAPRCILVSPCIYIYIYIYIYIHFGSTNFEIMNILKERCFDLKYLGIFSYFHKIEL